MGRLIDADVLKNVFDPNTWQGETLRNVIDNSPTAYDVDKVAEELKKEFKKYYGGNWDKAPYLVKAIEIVKGAVKG